MQTETQFSIFLVNKPGALAAVTNALAEAKISLSAMTVMDSVEHGVLRVVTNNASATRKVLRESHDEWAESDVLVLELKNTPGAFARVVGVLADAHINISYAYCTGGEDGKKTIAVFKVADLKKARKLLAPQAKKKKKNKKAPARKKTARRTRK
ncbi:MAG: ACT domain-containing protein [bacterium]|nr:ACT domain-containing protein [bacterium]